MTVPGTTENDHRLPTRQQRHGLLEQAMRHAAIGMALVRPDGSFLEVNEALCRLLGRDPESLLQMRLADVTHPDDLAESFRLVEELVRGEREAFKKEKRYLHADGHLIWGQVSVACLGGGPDCLFVVQIVDISTIKHQQQVLAERREQLERALQTDPLTGLPSRDTLLQQLNNQSGGALLSVGIDRLSEVNHALTHRAGDRLIQTVASRLVEAMGGVRGLARGTGDTFIVHAQHLSTPEAAGALAERLRQACKGPTPFEGSTIPTTVSVGVSLWRSGLGGEELLRDAVIAMRQAAANGRDRYAFADAAVASQARHNLELQEDLRNAIPNGELQLWFMPLVEMASRALRGYEALVRWHRPDGRIEQPDTFLPVARRGELAAEIDLLLLGQALDALATLPVELNVSVNLTPSTLSEPLLVEQVRAGLQRHGLAPERLHLEITETALLNRSPQIDGAIQQLAELGVRWVLDDFGTGYSSISNLRDLPIHGLKLDRSFTEAIRRGDQKSLRLAQALAGLGEGLGLITVAEGIERPEEAAALQDIGWQLGQGYYYGQPAPLSQWQHSGSVALQRPAPARLSRSSWALAVTDNVPVGLFALRALPERPVELLFVSRRSLSLLQLSREQIEADSSLVLSRLHPDDRPGFLQRWKRSAATGDNFRWEGRLEIDGVVSWLLVEAVPITQVDGSLIWQGVISDITPRKQQELHLRQILDEAPIPIVIQELPVGGTPPRLSFANRRFVGCFGYSTADIPTTDAWFERAYPNPELRAELRALWDVSVEQAQASGGVIHGREVSVTTADGDVRDAVFSAVVLGDEVVISAVDLTPWRRAEQQLSEARSALAETALAITEAIPVGTYTMVQPPDGGMGHFSFMSDRFLEICGLNREEAASDPFKAFACVHPDDYERWVQLNADTFARKVPFHGECRVVVDGQVKWIVAESVPRSLNDGSTVWEGVLTDITEQKQALQQVRSERALLNTVLSHIDAHVYMKDRDGRFLYANPPVQTLFSKHHGDIIGRTDAELLPPATAETFRTFDEEVFRTGGPLTREETFSDSAGVEHVFLSHKLVYREPEKPDCLIGFSTDITELRRATQELAASEEHFRLLAENVSDVVFRLSEDGRIVWVSPSLTPTLGWTPEEWIGQVGTIFLVHGGNTEHYQANLQALKEGVVPPLAREQVYAKDGSKHWVETHASPYRDAKGEVKGIVASFRVIDSIVAAETELRLSEERYRLLATTDSLTGVFNRRHLEGLIRAAIDRSDRYGGALSLILCDIDVFKTINDTHGHQRGDAVLVEFSQRIQHHLRRTDAFGRWGGEEFLMLLTGTDGDRALAVAEELRHRLASEPFAGVGRVTASFGVAQREPGEAETVWFRRVDAALYAAKQAGRNTVLGA